MTSSAPTFSWNKDDWAPLSEMADGFDEYRPAYSEALVGEQLVVDGSYIDSEDDARWTLTFSATTVSWQIAAEGAVRSGEDAYELFEMQPGLFYLHFRQSDADHPVVLSAAVDITSGQVTGAIGELGLPPHPHLARQRWFQGQIDGSGAPASAAHPTTDELIGRRIRYAYSSDDVYDHLYLNENMFTWLCLGGAELGFGDTDSCTYWKLRENTYLFSWLEKNVGVEGMVLLDLNAMRTVGIQFGIDQLSGELVNITMGSHAHEFERVPGVSRVCPGPAASL
ncbi:MoaF C-terminal domain-containing protein [Rhodococcus sp. APC 3903]|uniref:MoaF C-terminal domain-containing protein n=1 Tax=Rhodococcus sp. APC 3903 TaxID=3035193 RepID=UPI0025B5C3F6|nr:MoaF C-terminal domain-containing protein [Rhodococcus sp. APC 3903]MDN3460767.1 MoaF C-terminal domain-containing protein [Rhodococcus sp. APC 3903]